MLPGSLLRYHEKIKVATVVSLTVVSLTVAAVAVRSFCTIGQKLQAQGLLIHNVGVRSVVFNNIYLYTYIIYIYIYTYKRI